MVLDTANLNTSFFVDFSATRFFNTLTLIQIRKPTIWWGLGETRIPLPESNFRTDFTNGLEHQATHEQSQLQILNLSVSTIYGLWAKGMTLANMANIIIKFVAYENRRVTTYLLRL